MKNNKHQMLYAANKLRDILLSIENILEGYEGIEGNKNYVKYCQSKVKQANEDDATLKQIYDDTYNVDMAKRKAINVAPLYKIVEKYFKILDDIDTASDMFKPKWCKITKVVSYLEQLRWIYCIVENERNENGDMIINGECFKKEERIFLSLT